MTTDESSNLPPTSAQAAVSDPERGPSQDAGGASWRTAAAERLGWGGEASTAATEHRTKALRAFRIEQVPRGGFQAQLDRWSHADGNRLIARDSLPTDSYLRPGRDSMARVELGFDGLRPVYVPALDAIAPGLDDGRRRHVAPTTLMVVAYAAIMAAVFVFCSGAFLTIIDEATAGVSSSAAAVPPGPLDGYR